MVVIYAEKYSLARVIAAALGAGSRIPHPKEPSIAHWEFTLNGEAAVLCHGAGHLCELSPVKSYGEQFVKWDLEKYPCIPSKLTVLPKTTTGTCYDYVAEWLKRSDWIINATDADREGELIFGFIYESLQLDKPWKRLWLDDTTEEKIKLAFDNLKSSSEALPLQEAGRARAAADWLIGINLTIAATLKFGSYGNILPVGRVQTPTLNLVVQREKEITGFTKTPFWKLNGAFSFSDGSFTAEYEKKIQTKTEADQLLKACTGGGIVTSVQSKEKSEGAPLLYNTTQLQIAASKKLDWDIEKTTKVMQALYESALMSYPRTSSEHLTEAMKPEIAETLRKIIKLPEYAQYAIPEAEWAELTKRHFDDSKVGSHTAIIPTTAVPASLDGLPEDQKALYDLLVKSLLRVIFPKALINDTKLEISANGLIFKATGSVITKPGWYSVDAMPEKQSPLPEGLTEGLELTGEYSLKECETEPPKRYTKADLLAAMELAGSNLEDEEARTLMKLQHKGLGTDATRQSVISDLLKKELIKEKGKSVIPTDKGSFLIDVLPVDEVKSAELTGEWEMRLNDIALEKETMEDFLDDIKEKTDEWYKQIVAGSGERYSSGKENEMFCPFCGHQVYKNKIGYGCSDYKNGCKFLVRKEICGKTITETQLLMLIKSGKTSIIKGFKGKTGNTFDAALKVNKDEKKIEFDFPPRTKTKER